MSQPRGRAVRDRDVLLVLAVVVVAVLAVSAVGLAFPQIGQLVEDVPLIVILLIVVTGLVLLRALTRRRPAD